MTMTKIRIHIVIWVDADAGLSVDSSGSRASLRRPLPVRWTFEARVASNLRFSAQEKIICVRASDGAEELRESSLRGVGMDCYPKR